MMKWWFVLVFLLSFIFMLQNFTQRDRFKRVSQRDFLPQAVQNRHLGDIITLGQTVSASVSVNAEDFILFQIVTSSLIDRLLLTATEISLYEGSVGAANQIGVGGNVDESEYQIFISKDLEDARNATGTVTNIFVRNIGGTTDFSKRVVNTNDDGSKFGTANPWDTSALKIGDSVSGDVDAAVRFNSVTIPQGATINSATLTLTSTALHTFNYFSKIYGIDEDDTADFSGDPLGRTKTTASVDWDETSMGDETQIETPDISTIVQEIVDRVGWASGQDMGFIIENDGTAGDNNADFYDYGDNSNQAALLKVNYGTGSTKTIIINARERPLINYI